MTLVIPYKAKMVQDPITDFSIIPREEFEAKFVLINSGDKPWPNTVELYSISGYTEG